jgi:hypothetical protein
MHLHETPLVSEMPGMKPGFIVTTQNQTVLSIDTPSSPHPKEVRQARSNVKNILIVFNSQGIYHHEFIPPDQMLNQLLLHIFL